MNLRMTTPKENMAEARKAGRIPSKITIETAPVLRKLLADGADANALALLVGVKPQTLINLQHGKTWQLDEMAVSE